MASRGAERAPLLAGASRAAADDVEGGAQHPAMIRPNHRSKAWTTKLAIGATLVAVGALIGGLTTSRNGASGSSTSLSSWLAGFAAPSSAEAREGAGQPGRDVKITLLTACSPHDMIRMNPGTWHHRVGAKVTTKDHDNEMAFRMAHDLHEDPLRCGTYTGTVRLRAGVQMNFWLYPIKNDANETLVYDEQFEFAQCDSGCRDAGDGGGGDPNWDRCSPKFSPAPLALVGTGTNDGNCVQRFDVYYDEPEPGHETFFNRIYDGRQTTFVWGACGNACADYQPPQCPVCAINEFVQGHRCTPCPPGSTHYAGAQPAGPDSQCAPIRCGPNELVKNHECAACPPGTTNDQGDSCMEADSSCDHTLCGIHQKVSNHVCVPCEPGKENAAGDDAFGDDTECTDIVCGSNQYVRNNICRNCPAGTTRPMGDIASAEDTTCIPTYCGEHERVSYHVCRACAAGTENAAGDDASGPNTYCEAIMCGSNQRVQNHLCVACPAGSTSPPGANAAGGNTACTPTLCTEHMRVVGNACVPCPAGSENAAGDDATGDDTTCDYGICEENQHIKNHVCTDCAPGTHRTAGDITTSADTTCPAILCGVNQRVLGNQCVGCPLGTTNDAGDDASGSDTECDPIICGLNQHVISHACVACLRRLCERSRR